VVGGFSTSFLQATGPFFEMKYQSSLTGSIFVHTIKGEGELPITLAEAIDVKTGQVHPKILAQLKTGTVDEINIAFERTRVHRHLTLDEVEKMAAAGKGEGR